MKLSTSLVAVKKITSFVPRSSFSNHELEQSARLILEAEGIINPIVLCRTSLESYEVVDGDFEYYAAARAREIDLLKGEMIGAFIIEDENEKCIKEQINLLRKPKPAGGTQDSFGIEGIEIRLTNLESRIETLIKDFRDEQLKNRQTLEDELKAIKKQMPNKMEPLEVFNNLSLVELSFRLKSGGLTDTKAAKVAESVERERRKQKFESLNDVVERVKVKKGNRDEKGISSNKMLVIVDIWSKLLFN